MATGSQVELPAKEDDLILTEDLTRLVLPAGGQLRNFISYPSMAIQLMSSEFMQLYLYFEDWRI